MSMRNFTSLVVLMCFVTCNLTQGEKIRGREIPKVNMTAILGTWYVTGSSLLRDHYACSTFTIKEQSENKWTIEIVSKPRENIPNEILSNTSQNVTLNVNFRNDSNIIYTTNDNGDGPCIVMFEVVLDSHIVAYQALSEETIASGKYGVVYIFTRKKKLPSDIFEQMKESNICKQGIDNKSRLINIDCSTCD